MNLTHEQEMKLSELLFKLIKPDECWHDFDEQYGYEYQRCKICSHTYPVLKISKERNLFSRSAFLDVFDAVKDREDFVKRFCITEKMGLFGIRVDFMRKREIASPHFQLEVLKWLLEKDGRLGELEEVMKGGK